jgi:hypothetical protein
MRPQSVTVSSQTTSAWIPLNYKQTPFNATVAVVVSGTLTYSVEYTVDNVLAGETPTAFNAEDTTLVGATANQAGAITSPVTAVRLNVTAFTSGTATMTILQGGSA